MRIVLTVVLLALMVSAISITISRALIFSWLRTLFANRSKWLGNLITCPYCTSHYVAIAAAFIYRPKLFDSGVFFVDMMGAAFVLVALAMPMSWLVYRAYLAFEPADDEKKRLRTALLAVHEHLKKAKESED